MEDLQRDSGESPSHYMAHAVESKPIGVIVDGVLTTWSGPLSHQRLTSRNTASAASCRPAVFANDVDGPCCSGCSDRELEAPAAVGLLGGSPLPF